MPSTYRFVSGSNESSPSAFSVVFSFCLSLLCLVLVGCGNTNLPEDYEQIDRFIKIFPDYLNVTIPCNIAPLNFDLCEENVEQALTVVSVGNSTIFSYAGTKIRFSEKEWKRTLQNNVGKSLTFSSFVKQEGKWKKFNDWTMNVSADRIDPWVSYRKIAPGYEYFSDLALWSRNIESFDERAFFRARLVNERTCVNCHSFQNYSSDAFLFHMRVTEGGTVFCIGDNVVKRDLRADGMAAGCSYPAWRPNSYHVAFASCLTFQTFHTTSLDRVDVLDAFSDLYFYDVAANSIRPVFPISDDTLDTYPTWSADGKTLFYCSAKNPGFKTKRNEEDKRKLEAIGLREKIKYDVKKVSYDEKTGRFGEPELVFEASALDKSALFPRISPDGKTLLITVTRYGCFPIWYRDSDIWAIDLATGNARSIDEINSRDESDSYHSWSSNGCWVVFSSRRDDGSYTRLYFSHYDDKSDSFSKPLMLPQKNPLETLDSTRSYNIPEFTLEPVKINERRILREAKNVPLEKAKLD